MKITSLLFALAFLLAACTSKTSQNNVKSEVSHTLSYAKHFRFVTLKDGQQAVEVLNADNQKVMAQLQPLTNNKNIIALSASMIGMLDKLGVTEEIVGVSEMKYVYSPTLHQKFKHNKIVESGYEMQLNVEAMIAKKPVLILHSGFNPDFSNEKQFNAVGITCVPVYEWREETALGRAEWIKFFGFLFGKDEEATAYFTKIEKEYLELQATAKALKSSPSMFSGNVYGGEWYTPAGESFFAQLFRDANIDYVYATTKGTGSIGLTQEKVLKDCKQLQLWLNPGVSTLQELATLNSKAPLFDAFKNKQVYCHSHKESFYWEYASVEPQKVLKDLLIIAHPDLFPLRELYFYAALKNE